MDEEAEASGPGWERGRAPSGGADTGRTDRTAADAAGRQAGRWGWGRGEEEGWLVARLRHDLPTCWDLTWLMTSNDRGKKGGEFF